MFHAVDSPYLVADDGSFRISHAPTLPQGSLISKKDYKKNRKDLVAQMDELQRKLYASDRCSLLMIFQAMDAAGKDSTIRSVMRGIDPAGCQVYSFKQPSREELDHDFLWRSVCRLPERGRIGIFNRSYYEEVLVVRVHPSLLDHQKLPFRPAEDDLWPQRFASINDFERHLALNGTVILKFWLNVSRQEQRRRFLSRIEESEKNWKFSASDVKERQHWDDYMDAYQQALATTSRPWAPWYAIPADHKPSMRLAVSDIVIRTLESLDLQYPQMDAEATAALKQAGKELATER